MYMYMHVHVRAVRLRSNTENMITLRRNYPQHLLKTTYVLINFQTYTISDVIMYTKYMYVYGN